MHPESTLDGSTLFQYLNKSFKENPNNKRIDLPSSIGEGYVKRVELFGKINILIVQCKLNMEEKGDRKTTHGRQEYISFSFRNLLNSTKNVHPPFLPYIQLSSSNTALNISLPAQTPINNIIVGVKIDYLSELIKSDSEHSILDVILANNQPFLYEEMISDKISIIAKEIFDFDSDEALSDLCYKIKSEELIYHFLLTLLKRNNENYPINNADINALQEVRNKLLDDLTICPSLDNLAAMANMSKSKVSRLFKQIFGQSIYNYHQKMRILEAANLIKTQQMTVSDAGFQVGFSNLSHFTRIFERYMGMNPKKYSKIK
jgi:AraC-like DNA-binding protein